MVAGDMPEESPGSTERGVRCKPEKRGDTLTVQSGALATV